MIKMCLKKLQILEPRWNKINKDKVINIRSCWRKPKDFGFCYFSFYIRCQEDQRYFIRKSSGEEKYMIMVQHMYKNNKKVMMCAVHVTDGIIIWMGLRWGAALNSFLFEILVNRLWQGSSKKKAKNTNYNMNDRQHT